MRPALSIRIRQQRGMATLLIALVLLMAITVVSLLTAHSALVEQKLSSNQYRTHEAYDAAMAGLDYGLSWLNSGNTVSWNNPGTGTESGAPSTVPTVTSASGVPFTLTVAYARSTTNANYVSITATATSQVDSTVTDTVHEYARVYGLLNNPGGTTPLVVNGCLNNSTGTPDIWPAGSDPSTSTPGAGSTITTSQPSTANGGSCLNTNGPGKDTHLNLHSTATNSGKVYNGFTGSAWDHVFGISKQDFISAASTTLSSSGGLYYITSGSHWGGGTIGTSSSPAFIYFSSAAGCPKPSGNTTVWGIVYFENSSCSLNGWGNVTVHGSLVIDGDVTKINANTQLIQFGAGNNGSPMPNPTLKAPPVMGTWSDF